MAMYPTNTKLEDWLTVWLIHEVEGIVDARPNSGDPPLVPYSYSGMSNDERRQRGLPVGRQECIDFIKQHNPKAGAQFHD